MPTHASDARNASISRLLWLILGLNLGVAIAKLLYGRVSGSLALTADGLHSLVDAAANVIGIVGIAVARRPPDANHPYGHRKYETVAAFGVAGMLFLGCREIAVSAFARMQHPVALDIGPVAYAVMIATITINLIVVAVEGREGKRLQSELLVADAAHTRSDLFASLLVITSFVAQRAGIAWADVAASAVIVLLVFKAGLEILKSTLSTLSDERRIPPADVEAEALLEPGVLEAHNVRSRGPRDDVHIDLHVLVAPETPLADAHGIGHRVEERLLLHFSGVTDVVVHVEPALATERATRREGGGLRAQG